MRLGWKPRHLQSLHSSACAIETPKYFSVVRILAKQVSLQRISVSLQ